MDLNIFYGIIRAVVPAFVAWGAGKGWFTPGDPGNLADAISTAIVTVGSAIWSVKSNLNAPTSTRAN